MFILSDDTPGVWWPVRWTDYDADGNPRECEIEFRFLRHDREEMARIYDRTAAAGKAMLEAEDVSPGTMMFGDADVDLDFIMSTADDWRGLGVQRGNGAPVKPPFTPETLGLLLRKIGFAEGYADAHLEFVRKQPEIRRGNSKPSPDGGLATDPETSRPTTPRAAKRSRKS